MTTGMARRSLWPDVFPGEGISLFTGVFIFSTGSWSR